MRNILFIAVIPLVLAACGKEPEATELVADLAAGKAIAESKCSGCHGLDGRGSSAEIPNLTAQPAPYLIAALHAYRDGGRLHPALQDLTSSMSEADIANIAGYFASLPPLEHDTHSAVTEADEAVYSEGAAVAAICEECHGKNGISSEEGIPNLAGQQPGYLIASTQRYERGHREHEGNTKMLKGLEQVDLEKMAMYFASHSAPAREAPDFGDPVAGEAASAACDKCHGDRGISDDTMIPNLAGQDPVYLVKAIRAYRDHERSDETEMPSRTDEEIKNIAAYYAIQKADATVEDETSGAKIAAKCDRCHNPSSGERKLTVPSLRGQSRDYLVKAMKEYRREDRDNSMMHKMSARYSDEMIEALASYYASQKD